MERGTIMILCTILNVQIYDSVNNVCIPRKQTEPSTDPGEDPTEEGFNPILISPVIIIRVLITLVA